ncbi:uncharacterized protein LOC121386242 [Gigantopelta aegis]|uniref:uncharacterized protein LOC121386242 n=1 Tax=Gigantopelta aegis TaxID=1735272 RepID=UPI001B88C3D1|nr:uncharacterized protein LOC121386242 [Gigantopelta aegis]
MQVRVEVTGFTVHRHEDLSSIPHAKVYMMFVDFNERNVILEDPRKGLGDLRLLTVRTLWDLRGDVILVYAGDVGSKGLEGNDLYNYGLTSINNHTELSKLKNQQRMLSVHKTFSPYQRNHIKDIVTAKCV